MMKYFLVFTSMMFTAGSSAAEIDSKVLIASCQEYVAIYDRRGEKSLFASISTSVAEAMRAGVCLGVLDEHNQHEPYTCVKPWYQQALYIAKKNPDSYRGNREQLLDQACDR